MGPQEAGEASYRPPALPGGPGVRAVKTRQCSWCVGTEMGSTPGCREAEAVRARAEAAPTLPVPTALQLPGSPAPVQWAQSRPVSSALPCSLTQSRNSNCFSAWKRSS